MQSYSNWPYWNSGHTLFILATWSNCLETAHIVKSNLTICFDLLLKRVKICLMWDGSNLYINFHQMDWQQMSLSLPSIQFSITLAIFLTHCKYSRSLYDFLISVFILGYLFALHLHMTCSEWMDWKYVGNIPLRLWPILSWLHQIIVAGLSAAHSKRLALYQITKVLYRN